MSQSINYSTNTEKDYDELLHYIFTSMNFGFIHESIAYEIEKSVAEIFNLEDCSFEEIYDEAEDKEYAVKVLRNAIFVHTNHPQFTDEEIKQLILDYSKE